MKIKDASDIGILVNKENWLCKDYIPSDLVEVFYLCILYSHINSGFLISFVDVRRLTEPR